MASCMRCGIWWGRAALSVSCSAVHSGRASLPISCSCASQGWAASQGLVERESLVCGLDWDHMQFNVDPWPGMLIVITVTNRRLHWMEQISWSASATPLLWGAWPLNDRHTFVWWNLILLCWVRRFMTSLSYFDVAAAMHCLSLALHCYKKSTLKLYTAPQGHACTELLL